MGQNIYMLPSSMELKIKTGTAGYTNKILVSDGNFSLEKNDDVNFVVPAMKSHKTNSLGLTHAPAISQKNQKPNTIAHNEEKISLVLALAGGFAIWNIFSIHSIKLGNSPCKITCKVWEFPSMKLPY